MVDGTISPAPVTPTDDDGGLHCHRADFKATETQESFIVPEGVTFIHVKAWGAGANGEGSCAPADDGGLGGFSEAVFPVTAGMPLIIIVGKPGHASDGNQAWRFGFGSEGGGGLSGVFHGPDEITAQDFDKALIIAGGGGGATWGEKDADPPDLCRPGGTGNSDTTAGGEGSMQGSNGVEGVNGGGGGYRGGTGGERRVAGKGGTGVISAEAVSQPVILAAQPLDGAPPRTDDPDYVAPAGRTEAPGLVVLYMDCKKPEVRIE